MIRKIDLPSLTPHQLEVLRRFALLDATVDEVLDSLTGVFDIDLAPDRRTARVHFRVPEPGVVIGRHHISRGLEKKRLGLISERELAYWATMLLLNDAYQLDPKDEDFIAEWLNDISYNLDAT
jgi:hypothetical protein